MLDGVLTFVSFAWLFVNCSNKLMNYKHTLGLSLKDKHCKHFMGYREGITLKKYIMVAKRQGFNCVKTRGAVNYLSETSKVFILLQKNNPFRIDY